MVRAFFLPVDNSTPTAEQIKRAYLNAMTAGDEGAIRRIEAYASATIDPSLNACVQAIKDIRYYSSL